MKYLKDLLKYMKNLHQNRLKNSQLKSTAHLNYLIEILEKMVLSHMMVMKDSVDFCFNKCSERSNIVFPNILISMYGQKKNKINIKI